MPDEPIHEDVSSADLDPQVEHEEHAEELDPRAAMIERMAEMNNQERLAPEGAEMHGVVPAVDGVPVSDLDLEDLPEEEVQAEYQVEEGGSVEPMHEPEPEPGLPEQYADHPLAEFIEMDGENPMFRTNVNGQIQLIPLSDAQRELQKRISGDIKLRQNAEWEEQLAQREAALRANEVAYQNRVGAQSPEASPLSEQDVDDVDLDAQAREVVSGLFTGSEEEAAAKLAKLLKDAKGTTQSIPNLDPDELASRAAAAATEQIRQAEIQKDVDEGFTKFENDYPEIANDENLFRYADSLTDSIAAEHPDWRPSKVMQEAGKRTREWLQSVRGPEPSEQPNVDRQDRKRNLRPLPRARQGVQEPSPVEQEPTAGDYIAELRARRGQSA